MKITVYVASFLLIGVSYSKLIIPEQYDSDGSGLAECIKHSKWQFKRVVMISSEVEEVPYIRKIINALSSPVMIVSSDSDFSVPEVTFIVFSIKRYFYYNLFKRIRIEDKARVIIMWKWPNHEFKNFKFQNVTVPLHDVLSVMWLHQIYDVYIFVEEENLNVKVYTYLPYGETHCSDVGPPLHIDTWNATSKQFITNKFRIENTKNDTRRKLMKNIYGCPVKLLVKNRPPESVALMTADNQLMLRGSGGSILASLMKRYNFTVTITLAEDDLRTTNRDKYGLAMSTYSAKMLIRALRTDKYDFAFGVFSYLVYFSPDMDLSQYYLNENFAFYVPCGTKKEMLSIWKNYHMEFAPSIWACIGFVLCIIAFSLKIIATLLPGENQMFSSFWRNIFSLWAVHVENNVEAKTITITMRVIVTALMFYCTIMSVAYRASLKSLLLVPREENSIKTWDELEHSSLSVSGIPDMYSILKKISSGHRTLKNLRKRFEIKTSGKFSDIVDEVTLKKQTAYFGPESMIAFYNSIENEKNGSKKQNICQVNRIVATSPASPFLMRKGSMFLHIINQVTNDMVQTGQMKQFAIPQAVKPVSRHQIKDQQVPTSLQQLRGAFLLLLTGLTLAVIIFICETLHSRFKLGRLAISKRTFTSDTGSRVDIVS